MSSSWLFFSRNAALDEMRGNGLQLVPALETAMGLHDMIKQICHRFFFLCLPGRRRLLTG